LTQDRKQGQEKLDMTGNHASYTLDSTLESVNRAEAVANQVAMEAGFDEDEVAKISMAVREAAVNAVLHGNKNDPTKKVTLAFNSTGGSLVITVRDQGAGLDESRLPNPLAPENLLKQSGRGIFLMRSFMDEVRFRSAEPGTEITLIKYVGGSAGAKENAK
jgi:serine/threonine-protein kinase RsbW